MASKIARAFLLANGVILRNVHNSVELGNFAAGSGDKIHSLPYHVIRMDTMSGDSKSTVGYGATLADAQQTAADLHNANRADGPEQTYRFTYYVRDVRTGEIYNESNRS